MAVALLVTVNAAAHDFHAAICDVSFNAKTGNTEIVHTFPMHDIEMAFWFLHGRQVDLSQPADEALLRAYFDKTFIIENANHARLSIVWVGISHDTDTLTVYQELTKARLMAGSQLHNTILMDYFPTQTSNVNLRLGGKTRTLLFDRKHSKQPLF